MGLLPTNPDVQRLSPVHWILFYRTIFHKEKKGLERYSFLAKKLLGSNLGTDFDGKIVPLSMFINFDQFKKVAEAIEAEKYAEGNLEGVDNEDLEFVGEDVDQEMEDVFSTDIDALLTPDELAKIDELEEQERIRLEKLVGVKHEEEDGGN